jgi:hypothetical protein
MKAKDDTTDPRPPIEPIVASVRARLTWPTVLTVIHPKVSGYEVKPPKI